MNIFPKTHSLLFWAAITMFAGTGCSHFTPAAPEVRVIRPVRGELVSSFVASGRIGAKTIHLAPGERGRMISLKVKVNDIVHRGQLLAVLDDGEQRARLRTLEADLDSAIHRRSEAAENVDSKRSELHSDLERAQASRDQAFQHYQEVTASASSDVLESARATLQEAQARYTQSEQDLARQRKLFSQEIISPAQFEKAQSAYAQSVAQRAQARADLDKIRSGPRPETINVARSELAKADVDVSAARASDSELPGMEERYRASAGDIQKIEGEIDSARLDLAHTRVTSPCAGVISAVLVEPGEIAVADSPILNIQKTDELWVDAELDEQDANQVEPAQLVDITIGNQPDKSYRGKVEEIAPSLEQRPNSPGDSKILRVKIGFLTRVPDLRAGMHVDVQGHRILAKDVLHIPNSAILNQNGKNFVLSSSGGTLHKVEIEVGQRSSDQTVVLKGLQEDTPIVVEGAEGLSEGTAVRVRQ
jgi:RND family efflux transporter MFP subunit